MAPGIKRVMPKNNKHIEHVPAAPAFNIDHRFTAIDIPKIYINKKNTGLRQLMAVIVFNLMNFPDSNFVSHSDCILYCVVTYTTTTQEVLYTKENYDNIEVKINFH